MRERIADITAVGVEITRRLDYGYYNLLEKVGNLRATISSFQSVAQQSGQLISNFDKETLRLGEDTRRRVQNFKTGFEDRRVKAEALEERGRQAGRRAEELSKRLDNARVIVGNWERREEQNRRVWDRVVGCVWWSTISLVVLVVSIVVLKEWWFRGDPVKAGLRMHSEGSWNKSLRLGDGAHASWNERVLIDGEGQDEAVERRVNMPEDVKEIIRGIAERNRKGKALFPEVPREIVDGYQEAEDCVAGKNGVRGLLGKGKGKGEDDEDPWLRRLDEL